MNAIPSYSQEVRFKFSLRNIWRPILTFSHILFVVLVMLGTGEDRTWNLQQAKLIPAASPFALLNCDQQSFSTCCRPNLLHNLNRLYHHVQQFPRDLFFIEIMIYVSSLSAMTCILGSLLDLFFRVDSSFWVHRLINKLATITYIFCLFLISQGIVSMEQTPREQLLCSESKDVPKDVQVINFCYQKLGICRNSDTLMLVLICMVLYPIFCTIGVLCCGSLTKMMQSTSEGKTSALSRSSPPTFPNKYNNNDERKVLKASTKAPIVSIHNPKNLAREKFQSRAQLHSLLNFLDREPSCRQNENYLSMLARSFRNYIQTGNTPRINPAQVSSNSLLTPANSSTLKESFRKDSMRTHVSQIQKPAEPQPQKLMSPPPPSYEETQALNSPHNKIANQDVSENIV
ncbi:unnamed protein product [Allacma fusca]|uniref:Uncharacterized protein n=1 Tax=Allacma fusca TaxID=39272 RepID=A0A8J2PZY2_9HEXA|nr:unnamed protein product [Allacma fusca]